jgi:ribonuclease HII
LRVAAEPGKKAGMVLDTPPPDRFRHERELAARGFERIAGVDEAGRGPLAGPVAAAAAILPSAWYRDGMPEEGRGLNDSKQLTAGQREKYFDWITNCGDVEWAIELVDAEAIDRLNILQATHRAMNRALAKLKPQPGHVLVDGLRVKSLAFPQSALVKGDSLSYSIAAASVLAKVARDRLMVECDIRYPGYGFAEHKGYGTARHLAELKARGPCPIHRRTFAPVRLEQAELF